MDDNASACVPLGWPDHSVNVIVASFYICILAAILYLIFWLLVVIDPILRRWESLQWVYAFLVVDFLLVVRFLILYVLHRSNTCVSTTVRICICYIEAVGDIYLNFLQGYVLLALNICRYYQITRGGADIYVTCRRWMCVAHVLIYLLPVVALVIEIEVGWAVSTHRPGGSCDLNFTSIAVRVFNTIFGYAFPVLLTLLYLYQSLRHIRQTAEAIRNQQIMDTRVKHHRLLLAQSFVFYSVWLLLWSPHVIIGQYAQASSTIGAVAQLLTYVELTADPVIVTALDVRFLKACRTTVGRLRARIAPAEES